MKSSLTFFLIIGAVLAFGQVDIIYEKELGDHKEEFSTNLLFEDQFMYYLALEHDDEVAGIDSILHINVLFRKFDLEGTQVQQVKYLHVERQAVANNAFLGLSWQCLGSVMIDEFIYFFVKGNYESMLANCGQQGDSYSFHIYKLDKEGNLVDQTIHCLDYNYGIDKVKMADGKAILVGTIYEDIYNPLILRFDPESDHLEIKEFRDINGKFYDLVFSNDEFLILGNKTSGTGRYNNQKGYDPQEVNRILTTDQSFNRLDSTSFKFVYNSYADKLIELKEDDYLIKITNGYRSLKNGFYHLKKNELIKSWINRKDQFIYELLLHDGDPVILLSEEQDLCATLLLKKYGEYNWEVSIAKNLSSDHALIFEYKGYYYLLSQRSGHCEKPGTFNSKSVIIKLKISS